MDHTEAIVELKNIVTPSFIKEIIPFIEDRAKDNLTIRNEVIDKSYRNVKGHSLNFKTPTNLFYWRFIKKEIERL